MLLWHLQVFEETQVVTAMQEEVERTRENIHYLENQVAEASEQQVGYSCAPIS
jgi:hypothetical protein